jgi:hypothetical protein
MCTTKFFLRQLSLLLQKFCFRNNFLLDCLLLLKRYDTPNYGLHTAFGSFPFHLTH